MTQALYAEGGSLPQGLMIQNIYTEMCDSSKNVTIIVRNSMAYPQTLRKKIPVAKVVVATQVPEPLVQTGMIEALDKAQGLQTVKQRQEKLFKKVGSEWSRVLATLVDGFNLVSLGWVPWYFLLGAQWTWLFSFNWTCDQSHQWCPFKEWFRQIPPMLVEEVPYTLARDVGFWHNSTQPECMV